MPALKPRFSVTAKVAAGLALIIAIGLVSMLLIYRGLDRVELALGRLADVQAPLSAAAYEMELNLNGTGLAVLKYLATRRPEYRDWADGDESDFKEFHATYLRLAETPRERALGQRVGVMHREFAQLGHELMEQADRQEQLYRAITDRSDEIDYVLDARLQPGLFSTKTILRDGPGAAVASADFEAELAEVGMSVANYHRKPTPAARRAILAKLRTLDRSLAHLASFNLGEPQRRHASALPAVTTKVADNVRQVVALEDEIHGGRERLIELRESIDELLDDEIQILALRGLDQPRISAKIAADEAVAAMRYLIPLFLLSAGLIGFLLVQVIRVPLARLGRGTRAIASGDLTHRMEPATNDEFGDLAIQYNSMVERLEATTVSRDRLEKSETMLRHSVGELRREMADRERAEQERERLQVELRRSETMSAMGSLVAGVAHEVRNPLFGISSTLDAMIARLGEQPAYRRYLEVLQSEVSRLGKLMEDLLSYGRPPSHEFAVDALHTAISPAVDSCGELARRVGATIAADMDARPVRVRMDAVRLAQVFRNLVDNALQHSPAGAVVSLEQSVHEEGGRRFVACTVKDSGTGFEPGDLPRIFEPFFTRRRGGTGLGLALAQRIVLEHGGEITAENRLEGGASVSVRLPLADD